MWTPAALQQHSAWASMLIVCKLAEMMVDEVRHVPGAHGLLECQEPQQNVATCSLPPPLRIFLRYCCVTAFVTAAQCQQQLCMLLGLLCIRVCT